MKKQMFALWGGLLLLTLLIFSAFLVLNRKEVVLDEVSLREYEDNSDGIFAIMIENDSGDYEESTDNSFPTNMVFNSTLSGCIDNDGNTIDNTLSYSSGIVTVSTSQTSYCYIYFDKFECNEGASFSQCLVSFASSNGGTDTTLIEHSSDCDNGCGQDGKYRYSGGGTSSTTEVNNYVCFGTNDLDTCLADTDTYLFRIIEVDPDTGNVKLIKSTSYGSYYWNGTDGTTSTAVMYGSYYNYWAVDDTLYATLATTLNTTYLESFGTDWQNIIETYNWNMGGATSSYTSYTVKQFYDSEIATNATFKIGLMNPYDYGYAAESSYWTTSGGVYNYDGGAYKYDWLYLGSTEWTVARNSSRTDNAFYVYSSGYVGDYNVYDGSYAVRPSFYLTSSVTYVGGSGTADSPYLLGW